MADIIPNFDGMILNSTVLDSFPPELVSWINSMTTFFKAVGIIFLVYVIYLFVSGFFSWKRNRRINKMYHKVNEIDKKVDLVLAKLKLIDKGQKVVKAEIKEKEKRSNWILWPFIKRKGSVFKSKEDKEVEKEKKEEEKEKEEERERKEVEEEKEEKKEREEKSEKKHKGKRK